MVSSYGLEPRPSAETRNLVDEPSSSTLRKLNLWPRVSGGAVSNQRRSEEPLLNIHAGVMKILAACGSNEAH